MTKVFYPASFTGCFNDGNKHSTIWQMKNINHLKAHISVVEVLHVSVVVPTVSFVLQLL